MTPSMQPSNSPGQQPSDAKSLSPSEVAKQFVIEKVTSCGIKGAAAEALISQSGAASQLKNPMNSLYEATKNIMIQEKSKFIEIIDQTEQALAITALPNGNIEIDTLKAGASAVESSTPQASMELFLCFSRALMISGTQGVFNNFGPIKKVHDLEAGIAAEIKVISPTFQMIPSVDTDRAGLLLKTDKLSGFLPLSFFSEPSAILALHKGNEQTKAFGSLMSCNHRSLLLTVLAHAAKVPGMLNSKHQDAKLQACDKTWNEAATKEVCELYNKLDELYRPLYGDGIHVKLWG